MHVMGSVSPANERERFQDEGVAVAIPMSPPPPSRLCAVDCNRVKPNPNPNPNPNPVTNQPPPPPPPPPPPLLPPPPPPPPPGPGLGLQGGGLKKKKRVRSFYWKTIPEDQVRGRANLWTQGRVQQQYQIDAQTIEELFGQNDCQSKAGTTPTRTGRTRGSFRDVKEEVTIMESKRVMNVGIFLKQFKKSNQSIIDDIRHGNSGAYRAEPLRELLKLLPEMDEVKKLRAFTGDVSKLSLADSFMYLLTQVPSYELRIEAMLLKEDFPPACQTMKRDISILHTATRELLCCEELHAILHLVLQAGNLLNAGGYAGNAVGFKLSSLLSLADTKSNRAGMNLLHFVAQEAQKKDPKLLEFPEKLTNVSAAARISVDTLDSELHSLMSRMRSVEENIEKDTELLEQLDTFLQSATACLCGVRSSRQELKREANSLIDFFCEDRQTFRLDDCFNIFHDFCTKFNTAVKDNVEREVKEAARCRRLRELEEQKRHSWAGGEEVAGMFGMRCSSETDVDLSRHDEANLLIGLLGNKPRSRSPLHNSNSNSHSPLGRSGSLRRTRNSPTSSPSAATERELSTLLGMTTLEPKGVASRSLSPGSVQWRFGQEAGVSALSTSPETVSKIPGHSPQQPPHGEIAAQRASPPTTSTNPGKKPLESRMVNVTKIPASRATIVCSQTIRLPEEGATLPVCQNVKATSADNHVHHDTSQMQRAFHVTFHHRITSCQGESHGTVLSETDSSVKVDSIESKDETDHDKSEANDVWRRQFRDHPAGEVPPSTTGSMSVTLERHMLVPELHGFENASDVSHNHASNHDQVLHHHGDNNSHGDCDVITAEQHKRAADLYQGVQGDREGTLEPRRSDDSLPPTGGERDDGCVEEDDDGKVMAWCVTTVYDEEGENEDKQENIDADSPVHPEGTCTLSGTPQYDTQTLLHTDSDESQNCSVNQSVNKQVICFPANQLPLVPQPCNVQPVPISDNQSVPVSYEESSPLASSTNQMPALSFAVSREPGRSTNEGSETETILEFLTNEIKLPETCATENREIEGSNSDGAANKTPSSKHSTNETRRPNNSENNVSIKKTEDSKASVKIPVSKAPPHSTKVLAPKSTMTPKSRPIRTLTSSENQGMRRVVPITKPSRGASSLGRRAEKLPAKSQATSSPASTLPNPNNVSLRPEEKTTALISSRRSSNHKQDPKESKDTTGVQVSARESTQPFQRTPSTRKPAAKPKAPPPPEEKICRSALRALTAQAGMGGAGKGVEGGASGGRGVGSVSAPVTPSRKVTTSASSLPGFARSTASSSFRRTHPTLGLPPPLPPPTQVGSSKPLPKAPTPGVSSPRPSPFVRAGSLRVAGISKTGVLPSYPSSSSSSSTLTPPNQDSPLRRSQSIRVPSHRSTAPPPRGHGRNNSGSFSDKSSQSKDSGRVVKPSWR